MIQAHDLPVGHKAGWELEHVDPEEEEEAPAPLQSAANSFLIFHSLKQSRSNWLSSTFPKFSSRSRGGKASDKVPPAHTMKLLGKFDLQVGPHTFHDTSIYEAHYLPSTPVPQQPQPGPAQPSTSAWPVNPQYRASNYTPYVPYRPPALPTAPPHPSVQRASTPLVSAVASDTPITPALINRVNDAASTDPILANFLQLAASGRASSDQLKTLALLIQSLASALSSSLPSGPAAGPTLGSETQSAPNQPSHAQATSIPAASLNTPAYAYSAYQYTTPAQYAPPTPLPPTKELDLVLEFPERPYDRWLVPRVPVVCQRAPDAGQIESISLLFALPFPKQKAEDPKQKAEGASKKTEDPKPAAEESKAAAEDAQPTPPENTESPQEVVQFRLTKVHQVLWDSLLNWAGGSAKVEANRSILEKIAIPGRVYLQHQLPEGELLSKLRAGVSPYSMRSIKPARSDGAPSRRRSAPKRTGSNIDALGAPIPPKRKRSSQAKAAPAPKKIACVSCGQTDVPLMMGGRCV
ncbi:hypothetical protein BC834DRAFT_27442 [Gloeopeniophorella convolvens]|nr:hypothetical protein BC834DRAFT_27442 [Gloeopeniophorella convolvens]